MREPARKKGGPLCPTCRHVTRVLFSSLLFSSLFLLPVAGFVDLAGAMESEEQPFALGQVVVEFEPAVVLLPPNPGQRFIPLPQVPFGLPGLQQALEHRGIEEFEVFAVPWRRIDPVPGPGAQHEDYVPAAMKSFRDIYVLRFPKQQNLQETLEALRSLSGVRTVGRNPKLELQYWPSDSLLSCPDPCERNYQWNMENTGGTINGVECESGIDIGLRGAYEIQDTCTVKIGHLDTGVDSDHPDLVNNIDAVLARNFTSADSAAWEDSGAFAGHGTGSAGIIAATHDADNTVAGICGLHREDDPVLVPLKIWHEGADSSPVASWLCDALSYASSLHPAIPILSAQVRLPDCHSCGHSLNLSAADVAALKAAVYNAYHTGLSLIVSSGNNRGPSTTRNLYPAAFRHLVVGVTAIGCDGSKHHNLWDGAHIDLAAPGVANAPGHDQGLSQIVTTELGGGYTVADGDLYGGTSAAAPHVAGIAGLLRSHTSQLTNDDLRHVMQLTALDLDVSGYDEETGHGLVRADRALKLLDSLVLVHDSTSTIDTWALVDSCRVMKFKNISTIGSNAIVIPEMNWVTRRADVYRFETTVALNRNENPNHVPPIWIRGRQCVAARDTTQYDGLFEPYFAKVVQSDHETAVIRGYAYKVYGVGTCDVDSLRGWFPLNPAAASFSTKFSFSYLADTTSSRRDTPVAPSLLSFGLTRVNVGPEGAEIRFSSPTGHRGLVEIFDVAGRSVRRIEIPAGAPGSRTVAWDGRGASGSRLPSGMYFGRLEVGEFREQVRMVVIR